MSSAETQPRSPWRPLFAWFDAYFATILSTGGVLTTLFLIPQTAAILSQAGFSDYAYDTTGTVLRSIALVATALAVLVLVVVVIPPDRDHDQSNPLRDSVVSRVQLWALARSEFLSVLVLRVLGRFSKVGRRLIGVLLVALGAALALVLDPASMTAASGQPDFSSSWPSIVVAGLGAWAALVPDRIIGDPSTSRGDGASRPACSW